MFVFYFTDRRRDTLRRTFHNVVATILLITVLWKCTTVLMPATLVSLESTLTTTAVVKDVQQNVRHGNPRLPSVLCLVLTTSNKPDKTSAVNATWGRRCDKVLYVYGSSKTLTVEDKLFVNVKEIRPNRPAKVKAAMQYAYAAYNMSFDWILKADDDTYVIMENLKLLLSQHKAEESNYLGAHFKLHVKNGFMSGGAGYVISSRALRDLVEVAFKRDLCSMTQGDEDVQMGKCMQDTQVMYSTLFPPFSIVHLWHHVVDFVFIDIWVSVNASIPNTMDQEKKETFHPVSLDSYLNSPTTWLTKYMKNKPVFGPGCCGRFSVTFLYVTPQAMYLYEHLLYRTSVYGNRLEENIANQTKATGVKMN